MIEVFIASVWIVIFCTAICAIVLLTQAINDQRRPRRKSAIQNPSPEQKTYIHPQPIQGRKPAPYRHSRSPKQGKDLQQALARSRRDHPEYSESWHWKNAQQQLKARQKELAKQRASAPPAQTVASQVQNHLFTLVNNDIKTANRLLEHTRKTNPLQTEQWVWEKVIFDLERDRH